MKQNKRAFTLIELLVVVLIIGILAAVALPQYNKAIIKSRVAEYETTMRSIGESAKVCELANSRACTLDELDIKVPACKLIPGFVTNATSCGYDITATSIFAQTNNGTRLFTYYYKSTDLLASQKYNADRTITETYETVQGFYCSEYYGCNQRCVKLGFPNQLGDGNWAGLCTR